MNEAEFKIYAEAVRGWTGATVLVLPALRKQFEAGMHYVECGECYARVFWLTPRTNLKAWPDAEQLYAEKQAKQAAKARQANKTAGVTT